MLWLSSFFLMLSICFIAIGNIAVPMKNGTDIGVFWHISDLHLDQNYSTEGDPHNMCHKTSNESFNNGFYGSFFCDAPENLINLTVENMKILEGNPNFIIWTGDNLSHTRNPHPDWDSVFRGIRYITRLLVKAFTSVLIFPCIGNHDEFPPNILDPNNGSIYKEYLEKGEWSTILPNSTWDIFKRGGFYSYNISKNLRIISLNTILWYKGNTFVGNLTDPFGQFKWLEEELENAFLYFTKVYIIGHVAPGFYNRVQPGTIAGPTFHFHFLNRYLNIVKKYSKVISGQMFGHEHYDFFQLQYCDTGYVQNSVLLASSVSPWHSRKLKFNLSLPVHPSIRLMIYDKMSCMLKDYRQYFLNLTKANNNNENHEGKIYYEPLYNFTTAYAVDDISSKSLWKVFEKLKTDEDLYTQFFKFLTAAKETLTCDKSCKIAQLCSMSSTSQIEYYACMGNGIIISESNGKVSAIGLIIYIGIVVLIIIIAVVAFGFYAKRELDTYKN